MILGAIWTIFVVISILFGILNGTAQVVSQAMFDGALEAVNFCISIAGAMCLWCAVMQLMNECGLSEALSRALLPLLKRLFPEAAKNGRVMQSLSANVSANLLGLGNAATPAGIAAARELATMGTDGVSSNELCRFVVLNTASIQILPTTVAAMRAAAGAASPFDILPAVWISSVVSLMVGLIAARLMEKR